MKSAKTIRLLLWTFVCMATVFAIKTEAYAQTGKIKGTIVNERSAAGVAGAVVTVKNTSRSAIADSLGVFVINAQMGEILVVTSTGYLQQEVGIGAENLNIQLKESDNQLENVVVIGYGVQKKKLATGANIQVKGSDLQKQSTTGALQALQGQAPGVQLTSYSGQPGSGMNVVIRGKGTVGNFSPLYVVDGIQTGDISYLNPADIESIDILKDAASAAIYGSQAANGVILVTTRSGKTGQKSQITLDGFYGVQNLARKTQLLNAKEYAVIINEAAVNSGKVPYFTNDVINNLPVSTDWLDKMFDKNVPTQNYVLGVQGGGGGSVYSASLGYTAQGGIVGGSNISNYQRYTFRINSEHSMYQNIVKLGQHLTFNYINNRGILVDGQYNNTLRAAFGTSPFLPMYDNAGNYFAADQPGWYPGRPAQAWNNGESNPYAVMDYTTRSRNSAQGLIGDVYLQVEPIKGLKFRSSLALNYNANQGHGYTPVYHLSIYAFNDTSKVNQSMGTNRTLQFDNVLSYDFNIGKDHSFSVLAGSSALKSRGEGLNGYNWDLRVQDINYAYLSIAQNVNRGAPYMGVGGGPWENALLSYFGRVQYNFREKYLLNLTVRADGSSKFAPDKRWGTFPSVSAGWVASNEDFMRHITWLDMLKIRASWGRVGNQNVAAYQFLAPVAFNNAGYIFGSAEGNSVQGAYPSRLANPNVKWETSEQTNLGFDATLGKLNVTFDYYVKTTKDWLISAPILATAGADAPLINGGDVKNSGVELALNYHNNIGRDFSYTIGVNGAFNKNTIGNIPTEDHVIHGNTNVLYANSLEFYRAANGQPVGYFWGLKTNGVFQSIAEVNSYTGKSGNLVQPNAQSGDVRFVDLNDDGAISSADKTNIGNPNPDVTFGFNVSLDYKGFDFLVQANGVAGNELVQSYRNQSGALGNYSAAILERWHGPGSSNRMPRVTEDNRNWTDFSDLYIHNGSFIRISTITLGYNFSRLLKKSYLSRVRLYGSVLNAFTFTKYNGMDPEVGYNESFSSGVDLGYYPRPRTLVVGANIRF